MHGRGESGLLLGQRGDCCRPGEHACGGCSLSLQMHGVDVVDEEAGDLRNIYFVATFYNFFKL